MNDNQMKKLERFLDEHGGKPNSYEIWGQETRCEFPITMGILRELFEKLKEQ